MMRILIFSCVLLLGISCKEEIERPENVIEEEQFSKLLYDYHFFDAASKGTFINGSSLDQKERQALLKGLVQSHGYTMEEFKISKEYYMQQADVMNEIYDKIIAKYGEEQELTKSKAAEEEKELRDKDIPDIKKIEKK